MLIEIICSLRIVFTFSSFFVTPSIVVLSHAFSKTHIFHFCNFIAFDISSLTFDDYVSDSLIDVNAFFYQTHHPSNGDSLIDLNAYLDKL